MSFWRETTQFDCDLVPIDLLKFNSTVNCIMKWPGKSLRSHATGCPWHLNEERGSKDSFHFAAVSPVSPAPQNLSHKLLPKYLHKKPEERVCCGERLANHFPSALHAWSRRLVDGARGREELTLREWSRSDGVMDLCGWIQEHGAATAARIIRECRLSAPEYWDEGKVRTRTPQTRVIEREARILQSTHKFLFHKISRNFN